MKIVILSEYNRFTSIGGTEYYVDMLIEGLVDRGEKIVFIGKGKQKESIRHFTEKNKSGNTYQVYLLPDMQFTKEEIKQKVVSRSWQLILPILQESNPDVIHVHTSTTFFNIRHFELLAKYFKNILFTTHIPGHFCAKGDLIQNNSKPCNGVIGLKCYRCMFSISVSSGISNLVFQYSSYKLKTMQLMNKLGICIVCPSYWQKEHLIRNGYDAERLHVIKQAIKTADYTTIPPKKRGSIFSIGYLGRLSPEKGSRLLIELLKKYKNRNDMRFVLGIPANSDPGALESLKGIMEHSQLEIVLLNHINNSNKNIFFQEIDCLLIPSYCIETGPIVLQEAVWYGKRVIAPDVGGPAEYAKEFKAIHQYKWNNFYSIIEIIERLINKEDSKYNLDANELLFNYENSLITNHLDLYTTMHN